MCGEIGTTAKSRWLSLYEILDANIKGDGCPSMVCGDKKIHSHELAYTLLARFHGDRPRSNFPGVH